MDYAPGYRLRRSDSIGSYSAFLELNQPSSFDLLRASIIRSIRSRDFERQGFLEKRYDGSNAGQTESYSNPKFTVVEVKSLDLKDNESDLSDLEQSNSVELHQSKQIRQTTQGNDYGSESFNTENSMNTNTDDANNNESNCNLATLSDDHHYRNSKESDKNSIKLARRKFNSSIFEDCSTYNITSSSIELDEDHPILDGSSKANESVQSQFAEDVSQSIKEATPVFPRGDVIAAHSLEEHTSLCDTFFPRVNDCDGQSAVSSFELKSSSLVEKVTSANDEMYNDSGETSAGPSKRRHSKRHRKRSRKKSKAKKPFTYECSKCGVSYVIPTKGMNKVACCLHCDLWVPVEPVFVKRDKTTWNTCQIC